MKDNVTPFCCGSMVLGPWFGLIVHVLIVEEWRRCRGGGFPCRSVVALGEPTSADHCRVLACFGDN